MRTRRHKYALFACDGGREELYDLHADPHERHNLAAAQPELAAAFRERALEWERTSGLGPRAGRGRLIQRAALSHLADARTHPIRGGTPRCERQRRAVAEARTR